MKPVRFWGGRQHRAVWIEQTNTPADAAGVNGSPPFHGSRSIMFLNRSISRPACKPGGSMAWVCAMQTLGRKNGKRFVNRLRCTLAGQRMRLLRPFNGAADPY
jgi:hypothetical protein